MPYDEPSGEAVMEIVDVVRHSPLTQITPRTPEKVQWVLLFEEICSF
jgi:hypothetical protein